jgi:hypothetical protein
MNEANYAAEGICNISNSISLIVLIVYSAKLEWHFSFFVGNLTFNKIKFFFAKINSNPSRWSGVSVNDKSSMKNCFEMIKNFAKISYPTFMIIL